MSTVVKMSSKNQIVIPKEARKTLGLKPGSRLLVDVSNGGIRLTPYPESFADALRGLHKEVWEGVDVDEYVRELREEWER